MAESLFTTQTPNTADASDGVSYELGMKFQSTQPGTINAIRYWKAPSDSGTHIGKIWSSSGTLLANTTFSNETAQGWQQQAIAQPLTIQANTTYVVSVNISTHFPITVGGLASQITNGNLKTVADGNNGVFSAPNQSGTFPTNSFNNSNYFRDFVFVASGTPSITKVSGDNQVGQPGQTLANPLVVEVRDAANNPQSGVSVNFAVTSGGGSVSPTSGVTDINGRASTVLTLGATAGSNAVSATAAGIGTVNFTATALAGQTVFTNQTPSNLDASDGVSYELGMKFQSTQTGTINAIRYWKAPSDSGTHIGKIWSSSGTLLANTTFSNETAQGWQQQAIAQPLTIQANTTYVVSVNISTHFPATVGGLASQITNGSLKTVADGNNGVFSAPNQPGTFPTNSFNNSNYFRDFVFVASGTPSIIKVSGDNQVGQAGQTLANPLVVEVRNAANNPQSGVSVNFAVTSGGGSVSPTSGVTDINGRVSTVLTLGVAGGRNTVSATATGIGTVNFAAIVPNAIYLENQNPGTTAWQITNRATNNEIAGYAGATSVNRGGSLPLKISLAQSGQYQIDVYRLGYYGGTGGRLIFSSGLLNGVTQPACTVTNTATRLIECNWSTSYTLPVGNNWTTGLYIAKLIGQATGKQSEIWFVVRDDSSTSNILFQSSVTTFQAYNNYGNNTERYSLYAYNSTGGQRAFKVSFNRPFSQTTDTSGEFNTLLRWEYNMVRWLEAQSYDVSYITNLDVHTNPQFMQNHRAFLSVGHDEYWSLEERDNVEQARNGGRNLAFFAANTAYWRVRFEPSSSGELNRVMVCYKEPLANDPVAPTYLFRGPENNRPENALLGIMYVADKDIVYGGFDFTVTNSADPYYANTNLANGDKLSLLVGFEWDAIVNNGFTPSGLVNLSVSQFPQQPDNIAPLLPPGTDPTISNAVRYTAGTAKVFATGSIQWLWGLDSSGVQQPREDRRAKQIAVNVLADLGAKPLTPDPELVVP